MNANLDFLASLSDPERAALLAVAAHRSAERGELIFKPGLPGNQVAILESGRVKIYHLSPAGREVVLWFCAPGEIFGLAEVCQGSCREIYAEASATSRYLTVNDSDFRNYLVACPRVALRVNDVLASRLRSLGQLVQSLVANDVTMRVSQLLDRLATRHGERLEDGHIRLALSLTHQDMADMIGTSRQSVSTVLSDLRRQGVVRIHRRELEIEQQRLDALLRPSCASTGERLNRTDN